LSAGILTWSCHPELFSPSQARIAALPLAAAARRPNWSLTRHKCKCINLRYMRQRADGLHHASWCSFPLISPSLLESAECFKGVWSDIDEVHTWESDEQWILIDRSPTAKFQPCPRSLGRVRAIPRTQAFSTCLPSCQRTGARTFGRQGSGIAYAKQVTDDTDRQTDRPEFCNWCNRAGDY
jgi:hypothetical protein